MFGFRINGLLSSCKQTKKEEEEEEEAFMEMLCLLTAVGGFGQQHPCRDLGAVLKALIHEILKISNNITPVSVDS